MKERPILFSAPMIRAVREGRKTQTRRLVKPQPEADSWPEGWDDGSWRWMLGGNPAGPEFRSPYGVPGDRLWGRENVQACELGSGQDGVRYPADGEFRPIDNTPQAGERWSKLFTYDYYRRPCGSEVPSIHMPRWACRCVLEIEELRIERLNNISEEDALAEGVVWSERWSGFVVPGVEHPNRDFPVLSRATAREMYAALWDVINGSGQWLANPWVWAVTFKPLNLSPGGETP